MTQIEQMCIRDSAWSYSLADTILNTVVKNTDMPEYKIPITLTRYLPINEK